MQKARAQGVAESGPLPTQVSHKGCSASTPGTKAMDSNLWIAETSAMHHVRQIGAESS